MFVQSDTFDCGKALLKGYRVRHHVVDLPFVQFNLNVPLPARFCLGCCKSGMIGLSARQYGGIVCNVINKEYFTT